MARRPLLQCWLFAAVAALHGCAAPRAILEWDVDGGDAWTFSKPVSGQITAGRCESIRVRTARGEVEAVLHEGAFFANAPLRAGENEVYAECRSGAAASARSAPLHWNVRLAEAPTARVTVREEKGGVLFDADASQPAAAAPAPIVRYEWSARASNPEALRLPSSSKVDANQVFVPTPSRDGEYYVDLRTIDALGRIDAAAGAFRVRNGRVAPIDLAHEHPAWVNSAVLYGVAPFFFGAAGFEAVRERIDEIAALGATAIWLSPITQSPNDDFGYAVTDYFRLRTAFGDEHALRALVQTAHAHGLKVIMDFVPNHLSDRHPYFLDAQAKQRRSPYFAWFERDERGESTHYFDWEHLKNLDYDHPEVRAHVTAAFKHWVQSFDIDGFRVDASWGVRERAPQFWPEWRAELKRIEPDLFLLAEASARDPFYVRNGFDAAYDWTDELGVWAWREAFAAHGEVNVSALRDALTRSAAAPQTLAVRFLNNNDTGARFITRHGAALTKVAATMLFTLPGLPLIYNGDEVGAQFEPYDEGPPIEWRDPHGLTPHYTQLATLRRSTPALYGAEIELIAAAHTESVLAYRRPGARPEEDVWVLLNLGRRAVDVQLDAVMSPATYEDLLTGRSIRIERSTRLGPTQALVLRRRT